MGPSKEVENWGFVEVELSCEFVVSSLVHFVSALRLEIQCLKKRGGGE